MAAAELDYVAFARPGGETAEAAANHPLDFAHLARQTFGDRALEAEILSLFMQQVRSAGARLRTASGRVRRQAPWYRRYQRRWHMADPSAGAYGRDR